MSMNLGKYLAAFMLLLAISGSALADVADFAHRDLQGKMHTVADYQGKWIVVNYWATWCPPCLEEIPDLSDFHDRHEASDAVVLGVNMEEISTTDLRDFSESLLISYPVLLSKPAFKTELGEVPGMPTSYLIAPDGQIVATQVGILTSEALETFIANYTPDESVVE